MKKDAVSVLKPRRHKRNESKVTKASPKKIVGLEKKTKKSVPRVDKPRGAKTNISSIRNAEIGLNFKRASDVQTEPFEQTNKTNALTKHPKISNKKRKDRALVEDKMAGMVREDRENGTPRGEPKKKRRVQPAVEPSVADQKTKERKQVRPISEKKIEPTIVKSEILKNKEKKGKSNAEVTKKVNSEVSKESRILQSGAANNHEMETSGHLKLTKQHILSSIKAIKKLTQKELSSKKSILPMEDHPFYLQITCMKIAKTPRRQIRSYLPHAIISPSDDIAIFVADLELGRRKDYEKTVEHWDTIFREKGIDCIKQIIPMNQVKTEYSQFEMKRKLASSFDYFFAEGRICGHLTHLLGKDFYKRKNPPTPVKLSRENLKEELNSALHKTCMVVHSYGNTHTVQVGTLSMKSAKLAENVWAMCKTLADQYPGGWSNIRMIQIKSQKSASIPIYLTLSSKNKVKAPVVKPKRPHAYETVEGELSTFTGHTTVTLTPEGKVKLTRTRDSEDEGEENDEIKEEDEIKDEKMDCEKKAEVENNDDDDENSEVDDEDEQDEENDDDDD